MITIREYGSSERILAYPKDRVELTPSLSVAFKDGAATSTRKIIIRYKANKDVSIYIGKVKRIIKHKKGGLNNVTKSNSNTSATRTNLA